MPSRSVHVGDVLRGIGADRRARAGRSSRVVRVVQDHAGVEGDQALGRGEQRVDVDLLDPGLLDDELAEADEQLLQRARSTGARPRTPLQRLEDAGLLHHPPRQRGVQRRQGQGAVLEDLDQLAAGAEQQDGAELRVEAAADDQLVAVEA